MLHEHVKVHAGDSVSRYSTLLNYDGNANGFERFPDHPMNPDIETMLGQSVPITAASVPATISEPAGFSASVNQHGLISNYDADVVPSKKLVSSFPNNWSSEDCLPDGHFACSHPGCITICARPGDLRRHLLKHVNGPKAFECPKAGCPRKGTKGFNRKDKMMDHAKVCQGRARGKYRG